MMMKRKFLTMLLVLVIGVGGSLFGLTACSNDDDTATIRLKVWGSQEDQIMLGEMMDAFETANPDKSFRLITSVNGEDGASKTAALTDLDEAADVFAIAHDQLGSLVAAGTLRKNIVYKDELTERNTAGSMAAATSGGELYGYPSAAETYYLYYDKRIYDASEVTSLETMLNKSLPGKTKISMDLGSGYYAAAFFFTAGCSIFGPDGTDDTLFDFNNADGQKAAKYMTQLKSRGVENLTTEQAEALFTAGTLGAAVAGPWKAKIYKDILGDNFATIKLPTMLLPGDTTERQMMSFSGTKLYVVKANTKHPAEAMALANFLTNKENQLKRYQMRNAVPTNKELANDPVITADIVVKATADQLAFAISQPSIPKMGQYWDPSGALFSKLFNNSPALSDADIKSELDKLVSSVLA